MIILDEINVTIDFELVAPGDVINLLSNSPPELDLVLTGRNAPREIIDMADTASEIRKIKHHYANGIGERSGIEF